MSLAFFFNEKYWDAISFLEKLALGQDILHSHLYNLTKQFSLNF